MDARARPREREEHPLNFQTTSEYQIGLRKEYTRELNTNTAEEEKFGAGTQFQWHILKDMTA